MSVVTGKDFYLLLLILSSRWVVGNHNRVALPPRKESTFPIGVDPIVGVNTSEKRTFLPLLGIESKFQGRPSPILITIPIKIWELGDEFENYGNSLLFLSVATL
jgi:hypothetical protein